jgi:MIP family channel proteins
MTRRTVSREWSGEQCATRERRYCRRTAPAQRRSCHSHAIISHPPLIRFCLSLPLSPPSASIVVHETLRGLLRPAAAELIGSALFVFIACGSAMTTFKFQVTGNVVIGISLTFGFTIFVLAYTIGHISGGHLNFAVTFTFCLLRKISILKCGLYFIAQLIGGLIGIGFLILITPSSWRVSCFAANSIQADLTVGHAFVAEFICTFMLMWVVMAACDASKSNQTLVPLAIGMAVFIAHMIAIPITGCSINPTRTFASSAAASGVPGCSAWTDQWVFWVSERMMREGVETGNSV